MASFPPAVAAPAYNINPLGLDDLEHTRNDGYKYSVAEQLNEAGQVRGYSSRFNGGSASLGWSAWLFDGATTIEVGLTGAEHTRIDGYKASFAQQLNEAGQVRGLSWRYNGGSTDLGRSEWLYIGATTIAIGLTDSEHTRDDGHKYSFAEQLNEAGQVIGESYRYNGGSAELGRSAWLYDGATTIDIGFTGPEYTYSNGYKSSRAQQLNEAGQVRGYSRRYNGGSWLGQSAWLYDGATTIDIGLIGSEHTRNDGYKYSETDEMNKAGQVRGHSERYNGGSTDLGNSVWLYNGATTIDVGLTGPEHTRYDGYKYSSIFSGNQLNEMGQLSGTSYRYNGGSTLLGQSTWLFNGETAVHIGLTGSEHTRNDGYKYSQKLQMNEAGQVSGYSTRYNINSPYLGNTASLGRSAWLYDGATTIDIGLTDAEHTSYDGFKFSHTEELNESGQVRGYSYRYGSLDRGLSAWLYDGATTINIGLTGSEHTRGDGYKYSRTWELNEVGQVRGSSTRFGSGSAYMGQSAWLYDGATTMDIGLTGAEHTRNDGYKQSGAQQLNEAGQVGGVSYRYNGGASQLGQDAWLYDPVFHHTFPLQLSSRSDGYAFSQVNYLGEDGLMLGTYMLFDALDIDLGERAFYFTIGDGLHDLGSLVNGGLAANGWDSLASIIRTNGLGQILGNGKLASQSGSQMAYLLTVVPEPSTAPVATLAVLVVTLLVRRRNQ